MPHYKDGTLAAVGDTVKGKGYNVKDKDGDLKEFAGIVVGIIPDSEVCNIRVAYMALAETDRPTSGSLAYFQPAANCLHYTHDYRSGKIVVVRTSVEYGQCDQFEKIA